MYRFQTIRSGASFVGTVSFAKKNLGCSDLTALHTRRICGHNVRNSTGRRTQRSFVASAGGSTLPTVDDVKSASDSFMKCVEIAGVLLGSGEKRIIPGNELLLDLLLSSSNGGKHMSFVRTSQSFCTSFKFECFSHWQIVGDAILSLTHCTGWHTLSARGFFVTLLSQPDVILADQQPLPEELLCLLQTHCQEDVVADLIVKNLVMSASMAIYYHNSAQISLATGSELTRRRSFSILRAAKIMKGSRVPWHIERMIFALEGEKTKMDGIPEGDLYTSFVKKWRYDEKQRQSCSELLRSVVSDETGNWFSQTLEKLSRICFCCSPCGRQNYLSTDFAGNKVYPFQWHGSLDWVVYIYI